MSKQGRATLQIPPFVFGTSGLGNIYKAETYANKKLIVEACLSSSGDTAFFDTAGKYGAGLSLEVLGACLADCRAAHSKVIISNKLGWFRTELVGSEPTFEPGVWKDLKYDAVQRISYQGILECFEQGNELLGDYNAQYVSVHDPDEYLLAAIDDSDYQKRYQDILEAYRALMELKSLGKVEAVGIGAKDWKIIRKISREVRLDWVMIANSLTIISHPIELIDFVSELEKNNIPVINSAIFNGGFLTGSDYYNYRLLDINVKEDMELINWRADFYEICDQYNLLPAVVCYQYARSFSGIKSIAMSTSKPHKVAENIAMAQHDVPKSFWQELADRGLICNLF
ncbi:aldo/keto reductase [Pedobacter rhizosphaerae]|uniref:D-threo-aldose 1-dehydrogenase n=1 Tax=Pedobacter rhizosphaerae TaxID=390241 RepID=A0A1H9R1W3_9SPHI|nr:aldo/keto reductase [Pedobacter rhizosphaerae]SER66607.1 D-threo-aldose 1-dehydrogenase [Pedobacter rhizosphaerae]